MSQRFENVSLQELEIAWRRTKVDYSDRRFVDHPHLIEWVDQDAEAFLTQVAEELESGYSPRPSIRCWSPKAGGLLRAGSILDVKDEVVFNCLLGRFLPGIHKQISSAQGDPDVAHQLADGPDEPLWIRSGFPVWKQWRERSSKKLGEGGSYMLAADVAAFYDNIDIKTLLSDIRDVSSLTAEVSVLAACLHTWSGPRRKGIPQGYSASDLLAKLYMNPVDLGLQSAGFVHLRYVDDFRIFISSRRGGRAGIAELTELLHNRGLSVQSAKTKVYNKAKAKTYIDGIGPVIEDVATVLREELAEASGVDADYLPQWEVNRMLEAREDPPPEILERAFQEHFLTVDAGRFNKSLFHFLLRRLGKVGSSVAVEHCLKALETLPEETQHILAYFSRAGLVQQTTRGIVDHLCSEESIYDYQIYEIVRWFYQESVRDGRVLQECRALALDKNRPVWLRSYSVAYLGRFGGKADLEALEARYGDFGAELERADVMAALRRMEVSRRNALYGRAEPDDGLVGRAVAAAKSGNL